MTTNASAVVKIERGDERTEYSLSELGATIGRATDNQIVLNDPLSSRHHARIEWRGDAFHVTDLGSGNGTQVNDEDIGAQTPRALKDGDVIRVGGYTLTLQPQPSGSEDLETTLVERKENIPVSPVAFLVVTTQKWVNEFALDRDTMSIGRDASNDIVINDRVVSRHHARLERTRNS